MYEYCTSVDTTAGVPHGSPLVQNSVKSGSR